MKNKLQFAWYHMLCTLRYIYYGLCRFLLSGFLHEQRGALRDKQYEIITTQRDIIKRQGVINERLDALSNQEPGLSEEEVDEVIEKNLRSHDFATDCDIRELREEIEDVRTSFDYDSLEEMLKYDKLSIDYEELSREINYDLLGDSVDYAQFEVDYTYLGKKIDYDDLSEDVDLGSLAQYINVSASEILSHMDQGELAASMAECLKQGGLTLTITFNE